MGIIKAATSALGGTLADQWLEVIEPDEMSDQTVFTKGVMVRKKMTSAAQIVKELLMSLLTVLLSTFIQT